MQCRFFTCKELSYLSSVDTILCVLALSEIWLLTNTEKNEDTCEYKQPL